MNFREKSKGKIFLCIFAIMLRINAFFSQMVEVTLMVKVWILNTFLLALET